jgi:hypothetical protein
MSDKIGISDQFRTSAERLAALMDHMMNLIAKRHDAAVRAAQLKAAAEAAETEVRLWDERIATEREVTDAAARFLITTMESEANQNLELLRDRRTVTQAMDS